MEDGNSYSSYLPWRPTWFYADYRDTISQNEQDTGSFGWRFSRPTEQHSCARRTVRVKITRSRRAGARRDDSVWETQTIVVRRKIKKKNLVSKKNMC